MLRSRQQHARLTALLAEITYCCIYKVMLVIQTHDTNTVVCSYPAYTPQHHLSAFTASGHSVLRRSAAVQQLQAAVAWPLRVEAQLKTQPHWAYASKLPDGQSCRLCRQSLLA
jgi:hypothetical protein